jgi:hypothetical protein
MTNKNKHEQQSADDLVGRIFAISMIGTGLFVGVVFVFIL